MSDIVKVVFDGDLGPLEQKQALAKGQLNAFVAESEAKVKGINSLGAPIKLQDATVDFYRKELDDLAIKAKDTQQKISAALSSRLNAGQRTYLTEELATANGLLLQVESRALNAGQALASPLTKNAFKEIKKDLAEDIALLEIYETRLQTVAATEVEVAVAGGGMGLGARPLQGYGGLFRATGLTNAGVTEAEGNAALNIISKLGISVSSLVVVGGVAALGAAAIAVSHKIVEEADKRLAGEELVSGAINKQVLGLRESLSDYQRITDQLRQTEALHKNIASLVGSTDQAGVKELRAKTDQDNLTKVAEVNRLQADLAQNERALAFEKARKPDTGLAAALVGGGLTGAQQRQNVGEAETRLEKTKKQLAEAEDSLRKGTDTLKDLDKAAGDITANQDKRFASNFENFARAEQQKREYAERAAERFAASVKAGDEEAKRLVTGYKEEFDRLFLDANKDNPFATQIIQGSKALETLDEKLKGVGGTLRKQALDLQAAANAQQLYNLQLNSSLQNVDLRAQAGRFRNPTQLELQRNYSDRAIETERSSNSTNPDALYDRLVSAFKVGLISREEAIRDFRQQAPGLSADTYRQFSQTIRDSFTDEQKKTQDTLDAKLDIAGRAKTDEQRAAADAAVGAFGGGLNPDDLTKSERAKIADALERTAVRNETRQQKSLEIQGKLLETLNKIDGRGETLSKIANERGKEGLDATITVKDETEAGVGKEVRSKRPTQADVRDTYGPFGSSGGLTSF